MSALLNEALQGSIEGEHAARSAVRVLASAGLLELNAPCRITVGCGTCGEVAGAREVIEAIERAAAEHGLAARIEKVGCRGLCWAEPVVEVQLGDDTSHVYGNMTPFKAKRLVKYLACGRGLPPGRMSTLPVLASDRPSEDGDDAGALAGQTRVVLSRCGVVDPLSIAQYCALGGMAALAEALDGRNPSMIISELAASQLRGRGGAGYPTGEKWSAVASAPGATKFFVVNGDEGDPGAYMDRALMESVPFQVIEGAIIGAYAVGAREAFVFVRSEYPLAARTMEQAIEIAYASGFLGSGILGSDFSLDMRLVKSAGAYICGEETSMIAALEGRPPFPRKRPPFPSESGLWGCPTAINNVETVATVPPLLAMGSEAFSCLGVEGNRGTKILCVTGHVERQGFFEVELGTSIADVAGELAGWADGGLAVKGVQIGGPSGLILPTDKTELGLTYEGLGAEGAVMGSGGIVVLGSGQCMVDLARYYTRFSLRESCGRCWACREGLARCAEILDALCDGSGDPDLVAELEVLTAKIPGRSLCSLGRLSVKPLEGVIRYFPDELSRHARGRCAALSCSALVQLEIDASKCKGERCCLQACPGNAIRGKYGQPGYIDQDLCLKCWTCADVCPYGAVVTRDRIIAQR